MSDQDYLHGYTKAEQDRLYTQAAFLEPFVFDGVDFSQQRHILELGCGVGAQTQILQRKFPHLRISGVDKAAAQLARARTLSLGDNVRFFEANAESLPFAESTFDGAFLCWFLEHVREPQHTLREVRRVLAPGALLFINEVYNPLFQFQPQPPKTWKYWNAFNRLQESLGGNPNIGIHLGIVLHAAGFQVKSLQSYTRIYDSRNLIERNTMLDYWYGILRSAYPQLIASSFVDNNLVKEMEAELVQLKSDATTIFHFGFTKAIAQK